MKRYILQELYIKDNEKYWLDINRHDSIEFLIGLMNNYKKIDNQTYRIVEEI